MVRYLTEAELIKQVQQGYTDAFEELTLKYQPIVYNISLRMLKNEQDAFDVSQDSLLKAFISIKKFNGNSTFSTWLYRITVNTCLDFIKKTKKSKHHISLEHGISSSDDNMVIQIEDKQQNTENAILKNERINALYEALDKLPPKHREMIVLRDIEGFSYEEISDITRLNLGTVKSKISRARLRLKELLLENKELFLSFLVLLIKDITK